MFILSFAFVNYRPDKMKKNYNNFLNNALYEKKIYIYILYAMLKFAF